MSYMPLDPNDTVILFAADLSGGNPGAQRDHRPCAPSPGGGGQSRS